MELPILSTQPYTELEQYIKDSYKEAASAYECLIGIKIIKKDLIYVAETLLLLLISFILYKDIELPREFTGITSTTTVLSIWLTVVLASICFQTASRNLLWLQSKGAKRRSDTGRETLVNASVMFIGMATSASMAYEMLLIIGPSALLILLIALVFNGNMLLMWNTIREMYQTHKIMVKKSDEFLLTSGAISKIRETGEYKDEEAHIHFVFKQEEYQPADNAQVSADEA